MFLLGAAFCYYVVVPLAFAFLIGFGSALFTALPSIGEYVGFFTKIIVGFGLSFEMPVVIFFFAKLGLVDDKALKDFFRYAIVIIFTIAAILTPPDILSQFLMAVPLIILYGISILVAKAVNPYIPPETSEDGSDLAARLSELFFILNTPKEKRLKKIVQNGLFLQSEIRVKNGFFVSS
jgi:sec-independent protein translocase protein TatC